MKIMELKIIIAKVGVQRKLVMGETVSLGAQGLLESPVLTLGLG